MPMSKFFSLKNADFAALFHPNKPCVHLVRKALPPAFFSCFPVLGFACPAPVTTSGIPLYLVSGNLFSYSSSSIKILIIGSACKTIPLSIGYAL